MKDANEISDVRDGASYDFSSRIRYPEIGQIIVWQNTNGLFAATKIIGIKDDSRGDDQDELTFEYIILPDGSADFNRG